MYTRTCQRRLHRSKAYRSDWKYSIPEPEILKSSYLALVDVGDVEIGVKGSLEVPRLVIGVLDVELEVEAILLKDDLS